MEEEGNILAFKILSLNIVTNSILSPGIHGVVLG
jgi:hypothetical protein